jgi:hypothetical protein
MHELKALAAICLPLAVGALTGAALAPQTNTGASDHTATTEIPAKHTAKTAPSIVEVGLLGRWTSVSLTEGDTLRVVLPRTAASEWRVSINNDRVLAPAEDRTAGHNSPKASIQTLTFTAKNPGSDLLVLQTRSTPENPHAAVANTDTISVIVGAASTPRAVPTVTPQGEKLAAYSGRGPCADCGGIDTRIEFYGNSPKARDGGFFVRTMTYLAAPHGDATFVDAGRWTQRRGIVGHPHAAVYILEPIRPSDRRQQYWLKGDVLAPLGSDGKPIQSPFNLDLRKQP